MFLNTHDGDDRTDPQRLSAPGSTPYPDLITEVPLNDERRECSHDGNIYRGKMGVREAFYVAKSSNKPIVEIGPSERSLNGLQGENKISCSEFTLISQGRRVTQKTHLKISRIVCHLENCSYIHLNVGEWNRTKIGGTGIVQIWTQRTPYRTQLNRKP
jgi:hypothetical protein